MATYTKQPDGSTRVYINGRHTYTIRKNTKRGYDKYLILKDGRELLQPMFSWFPTMAAVKRYCDR